jgi:D-amino-acid dehydrogenase
MPSHKDLDMRVVVLGAGLLGVTSAYYLQQLGHEVTVIDRHHTPAAKARGLVVSDIRAQAPLRPPRSAARNLWARVYKNLCRPLGKLLDRAIGAPRKSDPLEHLVRLAAYSRKSVRALSDEAGMPPGSRTAGLLTLFTDEVAFAHRAAHAPHWHELGCEERLLSTDEAVRLEPALQAIRDEIAGATYALEDPARDPAQFAASLVFLCRAAGVRFLTRHTVVALKEHNGRVAQVDLLDADGQPQSLRAQAYVLALGVSSVIHAESLDIAMPLRFVREYVVTVPIRDAARAPRVALRDRQGKLRITRVETPGGEFLRVTGSVRASLDEQGEPDSDRFDAILRRVDALFPGATDTTRATLETAMHAVSTNRLPMIGKTRLPNLFLNAAPGAQGWAHACGAGKSIARIVSGLRPELDFAFRGL